jgi:subtilase family serine protease
VYTCAAKPDLVVIEKWEEPEYTCCGLWNVIVHFVVQNIGGADAGPSIACKKVNGVLMDTDDVPALAAGESYASAFDPEPCPPGETINFTVCADNYDAVDESNETNNCKTNNYTCPAKPDLVVIEKWEEPVNGQVIVHFVIQNNATVKAGIMPLSQ